MQLLSSLWRTDRLDTRCAVLQSQVRAPRAVSPVTSSCLGERETFCALQVTVNTGAGARTMSSYSCVCAQGVGLRDGLDFWGWEESLCPPVALSARQTASSFILSILPLADIQSPDPIELVVVPASLFVYAQINLVFVHLLFTWFFAYFPQECGRY